MKNFILRKAKTGMLFLFFGLLAQSGWGQVTIASQDFESTPATPTMTISTTNIGTPAVATFSSSTSGASDAPASSNLFAAGSRGYRISGPSSGSATTGQTLTFSAVNTSGHSSVQVSYRIAGMSIGSGSNGMDASTDQVLLEVSPDGGTTWYQQSVLNMTGAGSNARWAFSATGTGTRAYVANNTFTTHSITNAASSATLTGANAITTVTVTGLPSVSNLQVRISAQCNSTNESWIIDNVIISGTAATPSIAISNGTIAAGNVNNGQTNVVLQRYDMAVTSANATLTGLTVTTAGTYVAADLSNLKVRYSTDATLDGGDATLSTKTTGLDAGSQVFPSFVSQSLASGSTYYIFVTADIASGATNGNTINIGTTANGNFTFSSGTISTSSPVAAGGAQTITVATPSIAVSANHPIVGTINQNSTNQNIASLAFAVSNANATLNSVSFTTAGTYQTSDLVASSFKLYYTTTNTFATTSPLGSAQAVVASGNTITFSGLSQSITSGTTGYVWLSVDVAYNANTSRNISLTSTAFSNITFATGTLTGTDPVGASNVQTFGNVTPSIAIAQNGPTASNVNLSTTNAILYGLSFAVTGNTTDFNSLTVTTGGTYQTSDLVASSFKLYYTTTNSFSSATQLSTSQAIVTSGNNVVFSGINQNILIGTTGYLWVTVDIDAAAVAARTINITSTTFTNITFAAGNKTGSDPAIAGGVRTITAAPSMTELVVPQYIASKTTASNNTARITIPICLQFDNLTASTAYDIGLQLEINGTAATSFGAGNLWNGSAFSGSTLTNAFTTNSSGSSGPVWFYFQPTGNTRFDPAQNLNVRVKYITNGGSLPADPNFIGTKTITALDIASSARTVGTSDDGAFITGTLPAQTSGKYVLLYTNETGTGDPIFVNQIITYTATNTTNLTDLPTTAISNVFSQTSTSNGQFAGVVPIGANNANGIRRIEVRNADNTVFAAYSTTDGKWGSSADFTTLTRRSVGTIDYTNVNNLTLNGSITLAVATSVFGLVTVQNSATLTTGGFLTLKSNVSGTASIGSLAAGTISGSVTVERYIPAKRAWRALTAPLKGSANNSIFYNWQNNGSVTSGVGVELWGPGGTGSAGNNTSTSGLANGPGASIKQYGNGWSDVTDTKTTSLFTTNGNNAYMVFVTGGYGSGNISSGFADTTLKSTGQLITGPVSYTGLSSTYHTLIGNPYASPIHPSSIVSGATNLFTNVWVWDPALSTNGGYVNYDGSLGAGTYSSSGGSYTNSTIAIQSGQAFFVRAASGTGSLTLTESMKSSSVSNTFRNSNSNMASIFRVGFLKQTATDWMPLDGCIAGFYEGANAAADDADGKKMINTGENIGFVRNAVNLSSEHYPLVTAQDILYLKVWNTQQAHYKLKLNTEEFTMVGVEAYLQDLYTGTTQPLNLDGSVQEYEFDVDPTVSASSGNRFRIVFINTALAVTHPEQGQLSIYPNPATGGKVTVSLPTGTFEGCSYELINVLGQVVRQDQIENGTTSQVSIPITGLPNSWYALRITKDNSVLFQGKLIIKN